MNYITEEQRELLAHTLGATEFTKKKDWEYRNRFSSGEECDNIHLLRDMVSKGFMVERPYFDGVMFFATKKGAIEVGFKKYQLAGKKFPKPQVNQ